MNIPIESIVDSTLQKKVQALIEKNTKPFGAWGLLAPLALKAALVQHTTEPLYKKPCLLLFASDHGICRQMGEEKRYEESHEAFADMLNGYAPLSILSKANRVGLHLVDMGMNHPHEGSFSYWFKKGNGFSDRRLGESTQNFYAQPAMTSAQAEKAMLRGAEEVTLKKKSGTGLLALCSMGAGDKYSTLALLAALFDLEIADLLGGLKIKIGRHQAETLDRACKKHPKSHDPITNLTVFGGFETAALTGAYLQAASSKLLIFVDTLHSFVALCCAYQMNRHVLEYCVFSAEISPLKEFLSKGAFPLHASYSNAPGMPALETLSKMKNAVQLLTSIAAEER